MIAAASALSFSFFPGTAENFSAPKPLHRIVSLSPSLSEMISSLGAADTIVGVTAYDRTKAASVGTLVNPSIEAIIRLAPDAVLFCDEDSAVQHLETLSATGIRAVNFPRVRSFDDSIAALLRLGNLLGKESEARELASRYRVSYAQRAGASAPQKVLFLISADPVIAASDSSYIGAMIRDAGGVCCAVSGANPYPVLSKEYVVRCAPDIVISAFHDNEAVVKKNFSSFSSLPFMNREIVGIDPDIACRYDPASMIYAKKIIEDSLYPGSSVK